MTLRALRGHAPGLGLVLLVALAARLIWAVYVHPDPADGRFDDTVWYRGAAHYLALGEGYYERDTYYASPELEDALRARANGFWLAMIALSGAGLILIARGDPPEGDARTRLRLGLPAIVLCWTAVHVVFFGDPRFHYPIVFVFALAGAHGAIAVFDAIRSRRRVFERRYAQA